MIKKVLAIETSCDDTSVSIVGHDGQVFALMSANQDLAHSPFGGIVPEIASRNHSQTLIPLIDEMLKKSNTSWDDIDGIAVTNRPGLIGSLIVGVVTAKTISQIKNLPIIGVNHLEGHILAPFLYDEKTPKSEDLKPPFVALAVSGGHTSIYHVRDFYDYEVLGTTRDDAAGEAFDKFGKLVGLGFPGGVKVDQKSKGGNPKAFDFPRSMLGDDELAMSFSGLKSSAQRLLSTMNQEQINENMSDLCASFQEAIVDVLMAKLDLATNKTKIKRVVITGGVSANSRLRQRAEEWAKAKNLTLHIPPIKYCTDNAAMIGYVGIRRMNKGETHKMDLAPSPSSLESDFR